MTGIGVIANAGVIVNNNIVLIDTYDRLRSEGVAAYEAILQTCRERARPVVLTAVTAMLGVLAIAFGINLDFVERTVMIGAPSTQWWVHLSTAIVFGLGFATGLTLVVTPATLMLFARISAWRLSRRRPASAPAGDDKSGSSAGETPLPCPGASSRRAPPGHIREPVGQAPAYGMLSARVDQRLP
jgi:multidrug efflux pump